MHSASRVQLGQVPSSAKRIGTFNSDPGTYLAGLAVRQSSVAGALTLLKSAGQLLGVSVGASLSDTKKTSVVFDGLDVPMRAHLKRSTGTVTITSVANLVAVTPDTVTIGGQAFTAQAGAATPGSPVFQASGTTAQTATSLATQINAHVATAAKVFAVANAAIVTLYAVVEGAGTGNDVTTTYEQLGTGTGATVEQAALAGGTDTISSIGYMTKGTKAYLNDTTGKLDIAMTGFSTVSDAIYVTGPLTGMDEAGADVAAGSVWIAGGL